MYLTNKKACICLFIITLFSVSYSNAQENNPLINSGDIIRNGAKLHDEKKYKEAITEYKKIDRSDSNYVNSLYELSYSCYQDSQFENSLAYAKLGIDLFPQKFSLYGLQAANSMDELKKNDEALELYEVGLKKNPHSYLLHFNKGIVNYKMKKFDESKKNMQQCLLINPFYSSAHYFLGNIYLTEGNLVAALLALKTYLLTAPTGKYYSSTISIMSSIAKVTDEVRDYIKNKPKWKEDNFSMQQDILVSKLALDKQYKLKADLEVNIVRQIQVVDEKLEYNKNDKGFCMQFYVPFFVKVMRDGDFEPMVFTTFSGVETKEIENWNKKNKKDKDAFVTRASEYFQSIKNTQVLDFTQRENTDIKYIYSGQAVLGKGVITKDKSPIAVGKWEYYYDNGTIKATGTLNEKGEKEGTWNYYHPNGVLKETSNVKNGELDGPLQAWFDNGNKWYTETYSNGKISGTQTIYYYNGKLKSIQLLKDDKKDGQQKYFDFKGFLTSTETMLDDKLEGVSKSYFPDGKDKSVVSYKNDKEEGPYKSYYNDGSLYLEGEFTNGQRQGLWTTHYKDGVVSEKTVYVDNEITGEFTEYHENGKLSCKGTYYKKKVDGKVEYFDEDGKIYEDILYDKGRLREINFYDKEGKVISTTTTRKGNANIIFYSAEGIKTSEGYFNKDGLKDGKFVSYYSSGKISEESNWKDGEKEGLQTSYYSNGKVRSTGNYRNDEEDGYFKDYYANGKLSGEGWKIDGQRQQKFLYYTATGALSSTEYYLDGELSGYAEQIESDNKVTIETFYENGWVKEVTQFDNDGKVISKNDLAKGEGPIVYKYPGGQNSCVGKYENYLLNGAYTFYFFDGSLSGTSFYKNGLRDSIYKVFYYGGTLKVEGKYKDGNKTGSWKYYYPNGKLREEEIYVNDQLEGIDKMYLPDGNLERILTFKNNSLEGPMKIYGEKNELAGQFNYKNDVIKSYQYETKPGVLCDPIVVKAANGPVATKYVNGRQAILLNFIDNDIDGKRQVFYSNGKLFAESNRIFGHIDGPAKLFYPDGTAWKEENYVLGNLNGLCRYYYPNGKLEKEENFYNDQYHGVCKYYDEQGKLKKTYTYSYGSLLSVK